MESNKFTVEEALRVVEKWKQLHNKWLAEEDEDAAAIAKIEYEKFEKSIIDRRDDMECRMHYIEKKCRATHDKVKKFLGAPNDAEKQAAALEHLDYDIELHDIRAYKSIVEKHVCEFQKDLVIKYQSLDKDEE